MELLAPAKNIEVARAAIAAGADAIYIGAPKFGARQAAGNSMADIAAIVRYAHAYGVKVLVTLNTLLRDDEREEAVTMVWDLWRMGVDALIVQDMRLLQSPLPPIRLHASTQCDNRTAEQVLALQKIGFRRAVLARELSIEQIAQIRKVTAEAAEGEPIELEVFVHGALCVSYSGRCFMSERLLGRSANRGECAQMCRMRYDLLDKQKRVVNDANNQPIMQRYLLSLKDMDRSQYIAQLQAAGVHTIKIEGRLKEEDYVTNVVAYYRGLLGAKSSRYAFVPQIEKTFHRGATDYFLHGRTYDMANFASPKSIGERVGVVTSVGRRQMRIRLLAPVELHNGDGMVYGDKGFSINSVLSQDGHEAQVSTFRQEDIAVGTMLYRNHDVAFYSHLHAERRIPVEVTVAEEANGFAVTMTALAENDKAIEGRTVCVHFDSEHIAAEQPAKAEATMRAQLGKLGDTLFELHALRLPNTAYFVPISTLNAWRREVTQQLTDMLMRAPEQQEEKAVHYEVPAQMLEYDFAAEPLMRCKYCLLHELGRCRKEHAAGDDEPAYIRLANGTMMQLYFDCRNCEMQIRQCAD